MIIFWLVHCLCDHMQIRLEILYSAIFIFIFLAIYFLSSTSVICDLGSNLWSDVGDGMVSRTHEIVKEESINAFGDWYLITEAFRSLDMEALYHQTNGLLSQTQGYYVRLEQVYYQNCKSNKDYPS